MITVLILGLLGGLDNLQVASALGLLGLKRQLKWVLLIPFVSFDLGMTLLGLIIGNKLNARFESITQWLGPTFLILMGLYVVIQELREKEKKDIVNNKWVLITLAFLLGFDNLFAGLGLGTSGYPIISSFTIIGLCSAGMCLLGIFIGEKARNLIPGKIEIISGLYLIGLGIFLIVNE